MDPVDSTAPTPGARGVTTMVVYRAAPPPFKRERRSGRVQPFRPRGVPMRSEATGRVLVADDDDAVRRFTATVLRSAGFEVDVVGTGFEATEALAQHS